VRQVLFNLLANAVGFSPPARPSRCSPNAREHNVVFSVTDRGPGIPPDVLKDKVFDWFESHSLGSQHRGPGIGLSLVRSFVELHGGTVTIVLGCRAGHHRDLHFPLGQAAARTAAE
jgi:signal transduction histidine kinase